MIEYIKSFSKGPIKVAIYGTPGSGKTFQYALLQNAGFNPVVINAENGLASLEEALKGSGRSVAAIDLTQEKKIDKDGREYRVAIPRGPQRIARLYAAIQELQKPEVREKFDTIFVDTLSEIADTMVSVAQEKESRQPKPDVRRAWGEYAIELTNLIFMLRDLPGYNVVFVLQEELDKDELTGQRFYGPEIPGRAAKGPFFQALDMVYRLYVDDKKNRFFQTEPSATIKAKHRGSKLQAIEPADLGAIMRRIKDGEGSGQGVSGNQDNRAGAIAAQPGAKAANPSVRGGTPTGA